MHLSTRLFVTAGGLGYLPGAPGTFGSLLAIPIFLLTAKLPWPVAALLLAAVTLAGVAAAEAAEREWGPDPGRCVIDEVAGQWLALLLLGRTGFWWLVAAFLLFRLLDIVKPGLIDRSQELPAGWGIMLDDLLAGLGTGLILLLVRGWLT